LSYPIDLLPRRLAIQRLSGTPFRTAPEAVRFFGVVQAQDHLGAKWSLGMRVRNATDRTLDAALAAGTIIRTHVLRPTWHFVAPEDLRWMLALSAPQVNRLGSYQYRELELGPKLFTKVHALLERVLAGGRHLTRAEVAKELERGRIVGDGRRIAHILMESELAGVVCSGAPKGKQQTYALVEEWVAPGPRYARADAVVLLAQRFFTSHGPATMKQFAWWSGLSRRQTLEALETLRKTCECETVDGVEWFFVPQRSTSRQEPTARLIPEYDEVLTGWADIGIPRSIADRRRGKPTNTFDRPILYGGKWVGTWRRTIGPKRVVIEIERFGKFSPAIEKALRAEAERYAAFVGMSVSLA
jgi:hypothetical protein